MSALYDILAPAKINLFLHVVGRMPNGYHALQSVFMLIDWCDRLHIETTASPTISRHDLGPPLPVNDLCVQAATALQAAAGVHDEHLLLTRQLTQVSAEQTQLIRIKRPADERESVELLTGRVQDSRIAMAEVHRTVGTQEIHVPLAVEVLNPDPFSRVQHDI
jgi:hypothetical protein